MKAETIDQVISFISCVIILITMVTVGILYKRFSPKLSLWWENVLRKRNGLMPLEKEAKFEETNEFIKAKSARMIIYYFIGIALAIVLVILSIVNFFYPMW